ncbi:hypothetical protein HHK36_009082 [Tetracentron sinense]|uniref:non-specific serine/threonine protein kinase n=1 Tax=Tetracentron sinense TaxID=13715 RepID=A0A834ZA26_TETSI|nr:hypothetical protein HHK36_009082 [Tetracentron sinense]
MVIPCISFSAFFLYSLLSAVVSADIAPGSTLLASNPNSNWNSPNGTFSLGFISASTNPSLLSAAISYSGIPVWKAGGNDAVVDSNAAFEFLNNGNLRLVNGSGGVVWESGTTNLGITTAVLDDSGNFVLGNNSVTIWSSFDNPTDTILPTQNFTMAKTLRSGSYSFRLLSSGSLTLQWNDSITYWNQALNSTMSLTSPSLTLQSIGILSLFDQTLSGPVVMAYSSDYGEGTDVLRFLRLDSDGNLRIYSSAKGSGISTLRWAAVADQCQVFGWCGNMGMCSYNDTTPICGCPSENFELVDPNDSRKGCKRKMEIKDCPGNATMMQLDHARFLTYPPELSSQAFFVAISGCRLNCLVARSCVASTALADGTGLCYFKVSDFVGGYQSPALPSTSFVKICAFFLYSLLSTVVSQGIAPGSTLRASNPNTTNWNSPNAAFSLGFISASTNPSLLSAAISYSGIPVWKAGGNDAVVDSTGAFEFLNNGNLRLVNGSGGVVWESGTANRGITTAALDDLGNFVLGNNSINNIWSSFDNPTDTILPTQNFTLDKTLRSGSYSFSLDRSGNLTLKWNDNITYWNQALNSTSGMNLTSPSLSLQSIGILALSDPTLSVPVVMAYSSDYGEGTDVLRFVRLDSDGNLRIYSSAKGSGISTLRWAAVVDQCQVFGWCGSMGICSYNDTTPICGCPSQNFEFVDPNDSSKGCKRKMEIQDCPGNATMLQLDHARFLTYPPELSSQVFFVGISACRLNCLVGSSCVASTSLADGTGLCYLKVLDFVSGYQSPALPSTSFVKVCGPIVPNPSPSSQTVTKNKAWKIRVWVVAVVVIGTLVGLVLFEGGLWWWCCRNSPKFGALSAQYALLEYASGAPVQFSYKELQRSTKGFKEKLGAGGFGAVYRVSADTGRKKFSLWAYEEFEKGNVNSIVDKRLAGHDLDMEQVMRAIQVSFWCIQEQPSQRPTMGKVVQMLEGITAIEKPPAPKATAEGSVSGTSVNVSTSVSALSTFAASAAALSSSSSSHALGTSSSVIGRNVERQSSSLLQPN